MARPRFQPTPDNRRSVETMSGVGVPEEEIAKTLKIDPKTLRKHFPDELSGGRARANAAVAQRLHRAAMEGNVAAMIFWLKTRAHWRERSEPQPGQGHEPRGAASDSALDQAIAAELARYRPAGEVIRFPSAPDTGTKTDPSVQVEGLEGAA